MILEVKEVKTVIKVYYASLSEEEAATLKTILSLIAGSPDKSIRKHVDSMLKALSSANIHNHYYEFVSGLLTCKDFKGDSK